MRYALEPRPEELLTNDPSPTGAQDTLGQTPTDIALAIGREDLAERLREHGA